MQPSRQFRAPQPGHPVQPTNAQYQQTNPHFQSGNPQLQPSNPHLQQGNPHLGQPMMSNQAHMAPHMSVPYDIMGQGMQQDAFQKRNKMHRSPNPQSIPVNQQHMNYAANLEHQMNALRLQNQNTDAQKMYMDQLAAAQQVGEQRHPNPYEQKAFYNPQDAARVRGETKFQQQMPGHGTGIGQSIDGQYLNMVTQTGNRGNYQASSNHIYYQQAMPSPHEHLHLQNKPEEIALMLSGADQKLAHSWNANAKEFVPCVGKGISTNAAQPPQPHYDNSVQYPNAANDNVSLLPMQVEYFNHPVILSVDNAVVSLTSQPTKFDSVAQKLTQILSVQVKEENLMKEIVTLIFEQGVGEANFRFSGGKLFEHLVKNVEHKYEGQSFKCILLKRCQDEFDFRHDYVAAENYSRLTGFTFFLAEIFVRLLTATGQPIAKLSAALCQMITILLKVSTNECLKCAAQVLKMSGRLLEVGGSESLDLVMNNLRDIAVSNSTAPNLKLLLTSVIEFRAAKWGVTSPSSSPNESSASTAAVENAQPVLGTVYYGPGGKIERIVEDYVDSSSDSDKSSRKNGSIPQAEVYELEGEEGAAFDEFLQNMQ